MSEAGEIQVPIGATMPAAASESRRLFFDVGVRKLVVMSVATFGVYEVYWFYRNWAVARSRGMNVSPLVRAIFAPLFAWSLFKEIESAAATAQLSIPRRAGALALLFFVLELPWRLPPPLWLLGFASVIPLALVQRSVSQIHAALGLDSSVNDRLTKSNVMIVVVGSIVLALAVLGSIMPDA